MATLSGLDPSQPAQPVLPVIDFFNKRVTDLKTNKKVIMPKQAGPKRESEILSLRLELEQTMAKYTINHCKGETCTQESNLTSKQAEGLESLSRRLTRDGLVAMETDKSSRLSVQTLQSYVESTLPHVENDRPVSQAQLSTSEKILNGHTLQIARTFQVGQAIGDSRRVKMALTNSLIEAKPLKAVRKDHKSINPGQEQVRPLSRPIGVGNNAILTASSTASWPRPLQ